MNNYLIQCLGNDYFRDPTANRIRIKNDGLHFGVFLVGNTKLDIKWDNVLKIEQTSKLADKKVSYSKAIAGGLIFGPVGAILGGMAGGRVTDRVLTIVFVDGSQKLQTVSFDSKMSLPIRKKIETELKKRFTTADRTES